MIFAVNHAPEGFGGERVNIGFGLCNPRKRLRLRPRHILFAKRGVADHVCPELDRFGEIARQRRGHHRGRIDIAGCIDARAQALFPVGQLIPGQALRAFTQERVGEPLDPVLAAEIGTASRIEAHRHVDRCRARALGE